MLTHKCLTIIIETNNFQKEDMDMREFMLINNNTNANANPNPVNNNQGTISVIFDEDIRICYI